MICSALIYQIRSNFQIDISQCVVAEVAAWFCNFGHSCQILCRTASRPSLRYNRLATGQQAQVGREIIFCNWSSSLRGRGIFWSKFIRNGRIYWHLSLLQNIPIIEEPWQMGLECEQTVQKYIGSPALLPPTITHFRVMK